MRVSPIVLAPIRERDRRAFHGDERDPEWMQATTDRVTQFATSVRVVRPGDATGPWSPPTGASAGTTVTGERACARNPGATPLGCS
jgi:hypothetical protein